MINVQEHGMKNYKAAQAKLAKQASATHRVL